LYNIAVGRLPHDIFQIPNTAGGVAELRFHTVVVSNQTITLLEDSLSGNPKYSVPGLLSRSRSEKEQYQRKCALPGSFPETSNTSLTGAAHGILRELYGRMTSKTPVGILHPTRPASVVVF